MPMLQKAVAAYRQSNEARSPREQEADVFRRATGALIASRDGTPLDRCRAIADNRVLWTTVIDLVRDPLNQLPVELRASIVSVGRSVQRALEQPSPDFDFIIAVNENMAAGLSDTGQP